MACNVAGSEGTCSPVLAGQDPRGFCDQPCADMCDGSGTCAPTSNGTICQAGTTCDNGGSSYGQYTSAGNTNLVCNGSSLDCTDPQVASCAGGFICGATGCNGNCGNDFQCVAGNYCDASGACAPGLAAGAPCNRVRQCASGMCRERDLPERLLQRELV